MELSKSNNQREFKSFLNAQAYATKLKVKQNNMDSQNKYVAKIESEGVDIKFLTGKEQVDHQASLKGNIENFIGYMQLPVGLAGPIKVNGEYAQGEFNIPLATSEGALVASYGRGMKACTLSGGVTSICVNEAVQRAPYFKFENLRIAIDFVKWSKASIDTFKDLVKETSNYCKLSDMEFLQEGNAVTITFNFTTGDAAGQNMVTIASERICRYILEEYTNKPTAWYIEGNYAGDKKPTRKSLSGTRGKKVISEIVIPKEIIASVLKSTPENMCKYFLASTMSTIQAGAIGNPGHVANGLTALYLACGQDAACIAETTVGILRMELTPSKDLYASLSLPALIVGTVGGGTHLSTQAEGLRIMDCSGPGNAQKFAELCGATALAGELSIAAAIAEDHFTSAHKNLGRK